MVRYLGVDLGATNTRAVVAGADGELYGRADRRTPEGPDGTAITEGVVDVVRSACRDAGVEADAIERAAVASVGEIDRERGGVADPANFPPAVDFVPVAGPLARTLAVGPGDVELLNDAVAGAVGERAAAPVDGTPDDLVYLSMSTGIGAGVVAGGRVLYGHRHNAAEVGHFTLDPAGLMTCGCGADGHWEAYCSGANLPRYARHLASAEDVETDLPVESRDFEAATIFEAAGDDELADLVLDRSADWNALGVAAVVHAYDPAVVAVGGAVALENPDRVAPPIRERLPEHLFGTAPELRLSSVGGDVVLYGALHRAIEAGRVDP